MVVAHRISSYDWVEHEGTEVHQPVLDLLRLLQLSLRPTFNSNEQEFKTKHKELCTHLTPQITDAASSLANTMVAALNEGFTGDALHKGGEMVTEALRNLDDVACRCSSLLAQLWH